jgi:hypothetical protein
MFQGRFGSRRGAMRLSSAATLVAVGVVVLVVSLPRLREFALRENEQDARLVVERLAALLENEVQAGERATNVEALVLKSPGYPRQFEDAEFLEGGTLMRRHGYLFEIGGAADTVPVRAWPWQHRRTGFSAYAWTSERRLVGNANADGSFSGPGGAPSGPASGWLDLDENR